MDAVTDDEAGVDYVRAEKFYRELVDPNVPTKFALFHVLSGRYWMGIGRILEGLAEVKGAGFRRKKQTVLRALARLVKFGFAETQEIPGAVEKKQWRMTPRGKDFAKTYSYRKE